MTSNAQQGNGDSVMAPIQVDPQEFGEIKQMVKEMHEVLVYDRCPRGIKNKTNLQWVWASVCGLSVAFGAGFTFLYKLCKG